MIVYRDVERCWTTRAALSDLRRRAEQGRAVDVLVELGQLEQGVLDALHAERDGWTPLDAALRWACLEAGRAFVAPDEARRRSRLEAAVGAAAAVAGRLPREVVIKPPEGYCHYGLDPVAYHRSAQVYARAAGRRARHALVVGVRSIGTSLSAIVAATIGTPSSITVRPRGASGSRRVAASPALRQRIREAVGDGRDVLVVDEGPGVTGETFACVAAWLRAEGVLPERIVLFPSHDGSMPLAPAARRAWFRSARRFLPPLDDPRAHRLAESRGLRPPLALSGGRWREHVEGGMDLPACVGFERAKHACVDERGRRWQIRFAGLGRWGEGVLERGGTLADLGLAPRPEEGGDGFVLLPWVEGRPFGRGEPPERALVASVARYLARRGSRFRTGEPVRLDRFARAMEENAREAGADGAALARALARLEDLPEREAVLPDGRLRPWEWIHGHGGWSKVDAVDHGDTFRLPGPADVAWDVAGAAVELGLGADAQRRVLASCARAVRQHARTLARVAAVYRPVYAAVAFGEAALSAREAVTEDDRRRLEGEAAFYADALRRELRHVSSGGPVRVGAPSSPAPSRRLGGGVSL